MAQPSKEKLQPEIGTPLEAESKMSQKEKGQDLNEYSIEEFDALMGALKLLAKNKDKDSETGALEVKINPETGEELALVYDRNRKIIFTTDYGPEIYYLKNPDETLRFLATETEGRRIQKEKERVTNKLLEHIQSGKAETDKES